MWTHLPLELKIKILTYLSDSELMNISLVNKHSLTLSRSDYVWKERVQSKYSGLNMIYSYYLTYHLYRDQTVYILSGHLYGGDQIISVSSSIDIAKHSLVKYLINNTCYSLDDYLRILLNIGDETKIINYFDDNLTSRDPWTTRLGVSVFYKITPNICNKFRV